MNKKEDHHFMVDRGAISKIIARVSVAPGETILEIGAGHGELTQLLAGKARVIAVEKDRGMFLLLRKKFQGNPRIQIIHGNALRELGMLRFDRIVSNLPYSICEPLLKLLPYVDFKEAFLTVPMKFSERLQGLPYSAFFKTTVLFEVPKESFSPPPKTVSVFVKVLPRETLLGNVLLRRKNKLKNAIKEALIEAEGMTKKQSREALKGLDLNPLLEKRVLDLGLKEMEALEKNLERFKYCMKQ